MPKTILLADDSVTIQKVVAISFASEDATVVTVDNGDDAIAKAREIRPDIVLADVVMPGKSGYEVCEAIKGDPDLAQIPVLLLTGTFEAFDEARAREVGSAGHIAKPFEAQALINEVHRLTEAADASATPSATPAESTETAAGNDAAFDFFDDDASAQDLTPKQSPLDDAGDLEFSSPDSDFTFGDDDLMAPPSAVKPALPGTPNPATTSDSIDEGPLVDAIPLGAELEASPVAVASADLDGDNLDDSLAPDASRSGDQPFDFAIAEEATDPTDPLADLDPVPPVGAHDLAQATVIDPLGASGYDVSSSDLGTPLADTPHDSQQVAETQPNEAELTMLAPQSVPDANYTSDENNTSDKNYTSGSRNTSMGTDPMISAPIASELTAVVSNDPLYPGFATPPKVEPVAVAVDEDAPVELAAELYAEPAPAEAAAAPAASTAAPAQALIAAIEPELRQQLHDTLEKIAWESFGDLTEAIVRQSVERVEAIAWEVIPRMAETLIQEEISRMKGEDEDA
jgi:CheY-like chemotaxis protein